MNETQPLTGNTFKHRREWRTVTMREQRRELSKIKLMKVNTQTSDQGPPRENEAEKIKPRTRDHYERMKQRKLK